MTKRIFSITALAAILLVSSVVAITQACWNSDSACLTYDLRQNRMPGELIWRDNSSYPIVKSESTDVMIAGNITIGDTIYTYPNDFTYNATMYSELNVVTGEGTVWVHKIFTFNSPDSPTLESWLIVHITGYIIDPATGEPVNPENMHSSGEFKLVGTGQLSEVSGFGIEQNDRHSGFISNWPM